MDAHVEKDAVNRPSQADQDEIVRQRKDKLERLIAEEGYNPYLVEKWDRKHSLAYVRENFSHLAEDELDESVTIVTAGRVMTLRKHGKAAFANLADETDNLQLYFQSKDGSLNDDPEKMGGFFTMLQYGVLFPLGGLGYLPGEEEQAANQNIRLETSAAHTLRWFGGIFF